RTIAAALQRRPGPGGVAALDAGARRRPWRAAAALPATPATGEVPPPRLRDGEDGAGQPPAAPRRADESVHGDAEVRLAAGAVPAGGGGLPRLRGERRAALGGDAQAVERPAFVRRRPGFPRRRRGDVRAARAGHVRRVVPQEGGRLDDRGGDGGLSAGRDVLGAGLPASAQGERQGGAAGGARFLA